MKTYFINEVSTSTAPRGDDVCAVVSGLLLSFFESCGWITVTAPKGEEQSSAGPMWMSKGPGARGHDPRVTVVSRVQIQDKRCSAVDP